jgi:glycosyltransferase involved in cell wall biosynthesis
VLDTITPVILTLNEEPNLERTLAALAWARDVVVVDSGSDDATLDIARRHANVRTFTRSLDSHAAQWNYATGETGIASEWILALDADYVLTPELVDELRALVPPDSIAGYRTRFVYCVNGRALRASVYPPVLTLFRRARGTYEQDGHTQRLKLAGEEARLAHPIRHDDRKPLARWLASQARYMKLEARKLDRAPAASLDVPDRLRKAIVIAPGAMLVYLLLARGLLLDGRPGVYYALQRATAELLLSLYLLEERLGPREP